MKSILILAIIAVSMVSAAFAESTQISEDGKSFDVSYTVDGKVLAVEVDKESTSLLIGLDQVRESTFEISFPSELLSAENGDFVILVDGLDTDYTISYNDGKPTITLPIPEATEEIEIIGTSVIPEFPLGVLAIIGIATSALVIFSRNKLAIK